MKTTQSPAERQSEAIQARKRSSANETTGMVDNRPIAASQRKMAEMANEQPVQNSLAGPESVQRQADDEEERLQGKMTGQRQAPEEEEMLQGRFLEPSASFTEQEAD